jgi:anti-sigma28 factor (negative regulator of flagellin synthesis)
MISSSITNAIAHLIQQREVTLSNPKDSKDLKVKSRIEVPKDAVVLSKSAAAFSNATSSTSEFEQEQSMKVERLKSLVSSGNYEMDTLMVDTIAERIANTLV